MKFRFRSIRSKMIAGFSLILLMVICLATYNVVILNKNNQTVKDIVNRDFPIVLGDERIMRSIHDRMNSAHGYVMTGDPAHLDNFNEAKALSDLNHEEILVRVPKAGFDEVMQQTAEWNDYIEKNVIEAYDKGNLEAAYEHLIIADEQVEVLIDNYEGGATSRGNQIAELEKMLLTDGKKSNIMVSVGSILTIILGMAIAFFTSRSIAKPLETMTNRMTLISSGDLSGAPLETTLKDEIGQLTIATNKMTDSMRGVLQNIHGVSQAVTEQSDGLTKASTEITEGSIQVAETMQELAVGSETQADRSSDLSLQMGSFTAKVQEANEDGASIEKASSEVLAMTNEGASLMVNSTEQMAKIDRIVLDAVEKVGGLDIHAKKISELVSVIQDIADQTNLLALNATIEAARAGEQGKGFAVVADEVRKLAEQSSDSVTNITDIVNSIQSESFLVSTSLQAGYKEVEEGSEQIKVTGDTFEQIREAVMNMVGSVQHVSENLASIHMTTKEMDQSIQEISSIAEESAAGVEQTSATTQETSSAMEEVAASAHELANMAGELNGLLNRFKI